MATIIVNGQDVSVGDDERLNCIQAADRAGVSIPFYCWHPGLTVVASCRMCLVEVGQKNKETGKIEMQPRLVPGCQTPAKDGTVIVTDSPKVHANQQFVQEGLLLDHPIDCSICDQAGECWLQDYYFEYGHKERRADIKPFTSPRRDLGPHVSLFADRCVMCSRCVRFTNEVAGTGELMIINRGSHAEIDVVPGFPIDNLLSGNVNDLCPVGALCSTDFLYQQRVWFMDAHDSVCTRCSAGCSIQVHENNDQVYRIQPRYNPNANDWWMCDIGRYENQHWNAPERLLEPKKKHGDRFESASWSGAVSEIAREFREVAKKSGAQSIAAVLSPFLTVEEAYLLATFIKGLGTESRLYLGKIPTVEKDLSFKTGFTIRAERCPNKRGVEAVIAHFQKDVPGWDDFLKSNLQAAYITGLYPEVWNTDQEAEKLSATGLRVVQDLLPSPIARGANYVLPGVSSFEKGGSYVNHAGLLQSSDWAIRPKGGVHSDGQTFYSLLGRSGIYHAADVLKELSGKITFFSRAGEGVPEAGLNLVSGTEKRPRTTQLGTVTHPLPTFRSIASEMVETEQSSPYKAIAPETLVNLGPA